eukprot:COSAG05_NODE_3160_length_2278_cov_4.870124_3_plen_45_part_00
MMAMYVGVQSSHARVRVAVLACVHSVFVQPFLRAYHLEARSYYM